MPRRKRSAPRSAAEYGIRGVLALAVAALAFVGITRTAGYTMRSSDPARAHAWAPGDGRLTALYALARSGPKATAADRREADRLARLALRQDPTAVAAASALGLNTQIRGDVAGARRLFAYAERLSRRDLAMNVWAIEDAVGRGDVAGALRHYDLALRTSREAPALLFPILSSAIADGPVRHALVGTMSGRPIWAAQFVTYAADEGPAPEATVRFFADLRRARLPVADDAGATVMFKLMDRKRPEEAWAYYALTHPGADRRRLRDPDFAAYRPNASPFDWYVTNTAGLTVSIERDDHGGLADIVAAPSIGGVALRQVLLLPPGTYRLEGRARGVDQPAVSRPYWALACSDGRELGRVEVLPSGQTGGGFSGPLNVPANCPVQALAFVIRSTDVMTGVTGQIDRIQITPAH